MLKTGPVWALGAMSGTSLDGVDAAMVLTDGVSISAFGDHAYRPYSDAERASIAGALGRWPGEAGVKAAAAVVEAAHVELLAGFADTALIGFHGQTLAHEPEKQRTHQVGDGPRLAKALKTPVIWDFRSTDVAAGGQGAPLAPFFHFACAKWIKAETPLVFLNLGGVGNLTWVDPAKATPEEAGALLAFDTGPANAPLNDMVAARLGQAYDQNGALAAQGFVDKALVTRFLERGYFQHPPPKSLDRNSFTDIFGLVSDKMPADAAATLTAIAVGAVAKGLAHCPAPPAQVLVTGGGRRNRTMMAMLEAGLGCPVAPIENVGLDGDMLEAQAFAYLAVRVLRGLPTSAPSTTGCNKPMCGGRTARP